MAVGWGQRHSHVGEGQEPFWKPCHPPAPSTTLVQTGNPFPLVHPGGIETHIQA